jgi:oxalate decarboxylase
MPAACENFGTSASRFDQIPQKELYIFNARLPKTLADDLSQSSAPVAPEPFNFSLLDQPPIRTKGGTVRIADSTNFKASKDIAAALVEVEPGGMRELHWHPNADEWQYYISGKARMTVFAGGSNANTVNFVASDVGYVPRSFGHYIENTGTEPLRFLEIFASSRYADVSLKGWMANTPAELVADHLKLDDGFVSSLDETKQPVVPG